MQIPELLRKKQKNIFEKSGYENLWKTAKTVLNMDESWNCAIPIRWGRILNGIMEFMIECWRIAANLDIPKRTFLILVGKFWSDRHQKYMNRYYLKSSSVKLKQQQTKKH